MARTIAAGDARGGRRPEHGGLVTMELAAARPDRYWALGLVATTAEPATAQDYRPALARLDIPVLVCTGSADPWSNHAVTAEIVGCLQRPEVLLIDGAGHLPNAEAETEFNGAPRAFLRARAGLQRVTGSEPAAGAGIDVRCGKLPTERKRASHDHAGHRSYP
jgi:pimeloyl-ACP methyl ester carboxylesterase